MLGYWFCFELESGNTFLLLLLDVLLQFPLLLIPSGVSSQVEWCKLRQPLGRLDSHSAQFVVASEVGHLPRFELDLMLLFRTGCPLTALSLY